MDLSLKLCGLELEHPILNGSGTFDAIAARRAFGESLHERFPFSLFVSKTITLESRAGNAPPRLYETPAGMVNSIGLPNKGLEGFLAQDLPELARLPVPLCVSVMAPSRDGFATLVERVGGREEVAAIELNVSCPNVKSGLIVGEQPAETLALVGAMRPLTEKPLIVKLTPNCADPAAVALAAADGGADGVSLINTLRATGIDPATLRPWLGGGGGGPLRAGGAPGRARPGATGCRGRLDPGDRHGRDRDRRRCARVPGGGSGRGRGGHGELSRSAGGGADPGRAGRRAGDSRARPAAGGCARVDLNLRSKRISPKTRSPPLRAAVARIYSPPPVTPASVDMTAAVPERSREQRMRALQRANEIRSARAQLKRDLKGGKAKIEQLLLDPPDYVLSAKAFDMILAVPKYGRVKANKILTQCRISPSKTIGGLSERQRAELVQFLRR